MGYQLMEPGQLFIAEYLPPWESPPIQDWSLNPFNGLVPEPSSLSPSAFLELEFSQMRASSQAVNHWLVIVSPKITRVEAVGRIQTSTRERSSKESPHERWVGTGPRYLRLRESTSFFRRSIMGPFRPLVIWKSAEKKMCRKDYNHPRRIISPAHIALQISGGEVGEIRRNIKLADNS